ncbi:MAG: hypothetical protein EZS28_009993 [Streblomastix strix]|uniref:Uncharacterized protein n=1 Tax=Streblomastix strix TaxID=222440 RepID=A0A5J4WHJ7_9EUKA|nr:MAG: hypothetical protein EZS28_009993 [Streblomastix strix]
MQREVKRAKSSGPKASAKRVGRPTDPTITIEEADAAIQGFKGKVRQQRIYGGEPSHDVSSKVEPSAPDQSVYDSDDERMELFGGYNRWIRLELKPMHPWYGKFPNEPHKVVDYKVTDQGALTARQRKILLSKEDRLNLDRPKTQKIATKRIISAIKAQEQLKNKLRRKKK